MFGEDGYQRTFRCRDLILLLTLLLRECLCLSKLVFYEEMRSWNEAHSICVQNGGLLISVNSTEMYELIGDYSKAIPWKAATGISDSVWIGLHATDSQGISRKWADCTLETWTKWHPSEPKDSDINQCVYLKSITNNFWMGNCEENKYFICEEHGSGACTAPSVASCYQAVLGPTGQGVSSNTNSRPASGCTTYTDNSATTDPNDQRSSTIPLSHSSEITTKNASPAGSNTVSPGNPGAQSFSTSQSLSTSQSVMTSQSLSTSQSVMTSQSLSSSQSNTTTVSQPTSFSTATGAESQTDCGISATTSTKSTNCVTSSTVFTTTVGECLCKCTEDGVNLTMAILQSKIENRKRLLTVNKSLLSSTIRKKESANDSRPSAKGIGAVGALFIVFVIGGIVLMDLHSLYVFISKQYRRRKKISRKSEQPDGIAHCYAQNVKIKLKSTTHS